MAINLRKTVKILLASLFFLTGTPSVSHATHIVGGDMSYQFLRRDGDNNVYKITLNIYYDCFPLDGNAAIDIDSVIKIAIYKKVFLPTGEDWKLTGSNGSLRMIDLRRSPVTRLVNPTYECVVAPTTVCVYESHFETEIILERATVPYVVTYQRCCRNYSIANLVLNAVGGTYQIEITPEAQAANNSSPIYKNYPPTLHCAYEPMVYDHSAVETEGDRLVYKLVHALSAPGQVSRQGCYQSPNSFNWNCPPKYQFLATYLPTYSAQQPMLGMSFDTLTGLITGVPRQLGQFVVAVVVEEWRGNVLMSKVYRDFQFNTIYCPKKVEALMAQADSIQTNGDKRFIITKCDSTTFTIVNNSRQAQFIKSFYWDWTIGGQTRRINDFHPRITVPDTGYYRGIFWVNKGERCYDSAYVDVLVGSGLKAEFDLKIDSCEATPIVLTNKTKASYFPTKVIRWDLTDTVYQELATTPDILKTITYPFWKTGRKQIKLTLTNQYNCKDDSVRTIFYQPMANNLRVSASKQEGCEPLLVNFVNQTPFVDTTYRIKWEFGDGTTSAALNPRYTYPKAGNYPAKLTMSNLAGCERTAILRGGISVFANPKAGFDFTPKTPNSYENLVNFADKSSSDVTEWTWLLSNGDFSRQKNPSLRLSDTGNITVKLFVRNQYDCVDSTQKSLYVEPFQSFFMPNAFTPNNDGLNDDLKGKGFYDKLLEFSFQVFNRWGEQVFQTNSPIEGWNGSKNNTGQPMPEGVYVYLVKYKTYRGNERSLQGVVQLTR